ncbi:MAG: dihydrodipicolinate synthase family protein [Chloroflexi bacterium]|nr:dihydrodipicolinate synthase family protein [Chloroflexota bacterium]
MRIADLPAEIVERVRTGAVIPAHPLALMPGRKLDERHQAALTRYYLDAGAGGIAVGVHTTQFEIRDPGFALYEPVLNLAAATADDHSAAMGREPVVKVAGVCGRTPQALTEARLAADSGYHACLLSLAALADVSVEALIAHCRAVAEVMPVFGFYLQPAVGGRVLPLAFWRRFAELDNVLGIKIAPFSRYQTLDVVRGVCEAGREGEIALYTGNDDNILADLLTEYQIATPLGRKTARIVGGLLGHWAIWTRRAVELHHQARELVEGQRPIPRELLTLAAQITEANAAVFDAAHGYAGCIPGIHYVLARQGLMEGVWCLRPEETLSPGQAEEIERVCAAYPQLTDDDFVREHLHGWLSG